MRRCFCVTSVEYYLCEVGKHIVCIYIQTACRWHSPRTPSLETKGSENLNKSKMFCFRLSESDYLRICNKAEKAGLSMSAYILSAALGKEIIVVEGLDKSIAELKAIGRNLNQLTTLCNMGKIQCLELTEIKYQFGAMVESVANLKAG